jgi:dihydrofolate reductase
MADSFDSISTNVGGRSTYQIVRKIYTTKFGQPVCFTMTRSLRSRTPSTCAVLKHKVEDLPTSALTKNRTANAENDDFRANLLTRLFDRMVRGN